MLKVSQIEAVLKKVRFDKNKLGDDLRSLGFKDKMLVFETFSDSMPAWAKRQRPSENEQQRRFREFLWEDVGNEIHGYKRRISGTFGSIEYDSDMRIIVPDTDKKPMVERIASSASKWFWENAPVMAGEEANGVYYVKPSTRRVSTAAAEDVITFTSSIVAVIESNEVPLPNGLGMGISIFIADNDSYTIATQISKQLANGEVNYNVLSPRRHRFGVIPAVKCGLYKAKSYRDGSVLMETYYKSAIPNLRRAIQNSFDLAIEHTLKTATEDWRPMRSKCRVCSGTGVVKDATETKVQCRSCINGYEVPQTGNALETSYIPVIVQQQSMLSSEDMGGSNQAISQWHMGGSIPKNHEAAKVFADGLRDNVIKAFEWAGLGYLFRQMKQESGDHKRLDKEQSESYFLELSREACQQLEFLIRLLCVDSLGNEEGTAIVRRPSRFNLESATELWDRLSSMVSSGIDEALFVEMKLEYIRKEYGAESRLFKQVELASKLDPLVGKTDSAKAQALPTLEWSANVLSKRIYGFIYEAERIFDNFWKMDEADRIAIIKEMSNQKALETVANLDREYRVKLGVDTINIS